MSGEVDSLYPSNTFYIPHTTAALRKAEAVKVVLLGNANVGKSSIIAYLKDGVSTDRMVQCGTPHSPIPIPVGDIRVETRGGDVKLNLWDTCGSEKYFSVTPQFLRGAKAVVLVYDVSDKESFDCLFNKHRGYDSWRSVAANRLSDDTFEDVTVAFLGHKADLQKSIWKVSAEEAKERLREEAEAGRISKDYMFWETSAKTGQNLEDFSRELAERFPGHSQVWGSGASRMTTADEDSAFHVGSPRTSPPDDSANREETSSTFLSLFWSRC